MTTSSGDYSVVIDVDEEGDLGDLEFNQDLEFHQSNFNNEQATGKIPSDRESRSTSFFNGSRSNPTTGGASASSSPSKRYLWSLDFYAQFFDVDTNEVLRRCWAAVFPLKVNFLDVLEGNPDLYGPVWITTTVVLILFLSSTIQGYFSRNVGGHYQYKFDLLSGAAGLMYGYTGIMPVALWGILKWYGSESANLLEFMCLYGYANAIWVFVAVASASPISILNWVFVSIGFVVSAFFLHKNLRPVISTTDSKTRGVLMVAVILLHAGLSLAIKILFFQQTSPLAPKPPASTPPPGDGGGGKPPGFMFF